jgi:hypothetical protein
MSLSFTTSAMRRDIVTRMKYLARTRDEKDLTKSIWSYEPEFHVDAQVTLVLLLDIFE